MIDVVIAGAGPTGLALACDLARRGIRCRVLDQAPGPAPGSRGVTLKPRSLEVLDDLGVADRVLAAAHVESHSRYRFGDGKQVAVHVRPEKASPGRPYPNSVALPQWRTREILLERLGELGVSVEFGSGVSGVTDGADSVRVRTGDGEVIEARYLVGADGGRSTVRGALGVPFRGSTHTARALLADVHVTGLRRGDGVHLWLTASGHMVAARPLAGSELWQVVGSVEGGTEVDTDDEAKLLATLRSIVAARTGRADLRLTDPSWLSLWRYNLRMVDSYRAGRVFLAGDAAHVHSPFGGHGMNTGLQDAHNLGWKLSLVLQGIADDRLLDTYQAERLPVGRAILSDSHRRMSGRTPPKLLRPLVGLLAGRTFARRARASRQDHPMYPDSPLTRHAAGRGPVRAGEPAPDASIEVDGRPGTLFDLMRGPHFTVLCFGAVATPRLGEHVRVHTVGANVSDPRGSLRRGFGAREGTVVVVRPDGYVGLLAVDADEHTVPDYFHAIGVGLHQEAAV